MSFLLSVSSVSASDPERVSIQTLFSPQALSYQQHAVTVEGVIQDLQVLSPFDRTNGRSAPAKCLLYGRAAFLLEDETGIIPVEVLGTCHPHVVELLPHNGDRVRITGLVQVLKSEAPRQVRIQAATIQMLEETH
ncbi:MAG: OB-fold nucleic acid binding domain-containing protein [Nitrospira sp.]|nr:OB-fold nucleic acid binding domain-containing protein [Nitrospira sp.]